MLATSMLVGGGLAAAGTAAADGAGTKAVLQPGVRHSGGVEYTDAKGNHHQLQGGILDLKTADGKKLQTYCIDLLNPTKPNAEYTEAGWGSTSLANKPNEAGKILWILKNSFPQVGPKDLSKASGIEGLTEDDAAVATQAAIWRLSDGLNTTPMNNSRAVQLTEYLSQKAVKLDEPKPTLSLSPSAVSGKVNDLLGPITVTSNGAVVDLSVDEAGAKAGMTVTDKDGKEIKTAKGGDQIYAKLAPGAKPGTAGIKASTAASVSVGRAFLGNLDGVHSQTLILAGSEPAKATAEVAVTWAPTGPIPAASAAIDCVQGAVVVTIVNNGDQDFSYTLAGQTGSVPPGGSKTVPVKVAEDTAYDLTVKGSGGFEKKFTGVLNCKTDTAVTPSPKPSVSTSATPSPSATPSTSPSVTKPATPSATPTGPVLANTGGGGQTPLLAGIAGALVIAGGAAVYTLRRRGRHSRA
ncbi:Cys-Gln thioester bond-forming surface protein [Kitasatospora sp. NPDC096147]|uniref:Cys-Gln thioester bond-forming surface protein n=1 Tax=Kitasatospora sp. NPDC096147 TaxID=3364093 RepID=UPI00382D59A5